MDGRIPSNYVLILPDNRFTHSEGLEVDDLYDPEQYVSVRGKVLKTPEKLV